MQSFHWKGPIYLCHENHISFSQMFCMIPRKTSMTVMKVQTFNLHGEVVQKFLSMSVFFYVANNKELTFVAANVSTPVCPKIQLWYICRKWYRAHEQWHCQRQIWKYHNHCSASTIICWIKHNKWRYSHPFPLNPCAMKTSCRCKVTGVRISDKFHIPFLCTHPNNAVFEHKILNTVHIPI